MRPINSKDDEEFIRSCTSLAKGNQKSLEEQKAEKRREFFEWEEQ